MARFVARAHNLTDNQPELVEVEAASVGDALRILAEEGFGTLDLMTADDAAAKGLNGRLINPRTSAPISASLEPSHPRLIKLSFNPLGVLIELAGVPIFALLALPALVPMGPRGKAWTMDGLSMVAMGLLALVTLCPIWIRPASTRDLSGQHRFGLWALILVSGFGWWLWMGVARPGEPVFAAGALVIAGLVAFATFLRIGWGAQRAPVSRRSTY